MRDFSCCGKTLPSLHDLLQHYEECHAQQTPQSLRNNSLAGQTRDSQPPNSKAAIAAQAANSVQQQAQAQRHRQQQLQQQGLTQGNGRQNGPSNAGVSSLGGIHMMRQQQQARSSTPIQTLQDDDEMEGVEDMEMDDVDSTDTPMSQHSTQQSQPSMFGQQQQHPTLSLLNTKMPGLRNSQPPTPSTSGFGFQNNPTVSSVNTPTLTGPVPQVSQGRYSPDASVPGTPAEDMDEDYSMPANMNMGNMNMMQGSGNASFPWGYNNDLGVDLCIDEPAKRLYSPNGGGFNSSQRAMQQQFAQFGIANPNQWNNNEMLQFRKQQIMGEAAMMMSEEHKPFRCPVIGCEKAYKNQNGLK